MTKLTHYDHTGKKLEDLKVSEELFAAKVSPSLMTQAIRVYQDRQHQHTSKVKTRGEINLTTAKWFKQKGTGRARHGAQSAPIFVGGGVAHGPVGLRPAAKVLPVKMRRLSLIGALSAKASDKGIQIISGLDQVSGKTADFNKLLKKMDLGNKTLLLVSENYPKLLKASGNLTTVTTSSYQQTNAYQVLRSKTLLIDEKALELLKTWLLPAKKKAVTTKEAPKATAKKETKAKTITKKVKTTK